jgi:hypothetical protein
MKRILSVIAVLFLFAAQLSAEELAVDLRYEPTAVSVATEKIVADVKMFKGIKILPFSDKRSVGETFLGELRQNGQVQTIKSKKAVAGYATDAFTQLYVQWGGKISPEGPLVLTGEITRFEFEENESYQAKVGFHFYLLDDSRRILWDGHSSGVVRGSGKAVGPENLSALFSNVLCAAFIELMEDQKLVSVWSGRDSNTYLLKDDASAVKTAR